MPPLFLFLLLCSFGESLSMRCQSEQTYFQFLYNLCIGSAPCRHLYHLYPTETNAMASMTVAERESFIAYRNERDFQLFQHQLSARPIFSLLEEEGGGGTVENTMLLMSVLSEDTFRHITVLVNESQESSDCIVGENMDQKVLISLSALHSLHLYKMTVADELFCHDPNERLLLDVNNEAHCICKQGKVCSQDINYEQTIPVLLIILIAVIMAWLIAIFASLYAKRGFLYQLELSQQRLSQK
jgi:hypothetical protein